MQMDLRLLGLNTDCAVEGFEVSCQQRMIVLRFQEMTMIGDFAIEEVDDYFL